MQRSNTYVIIFSAIMTIIIGGVMSTASVVLKPAQDKQIELDTKKKILGAVMDISSIKDPNQLLDIYKSRVRSIVVDLEGNPVKNDEKGNVLEAEKINIQKNHKTAAESRVYPVFMWMEENDSTQVNAYIFPMFGNGLWDWISGFIAVDKDLNTVRGIAFDHKGETPGLGARITDEKVQARYVGKKIFDESGNVISITMVKGEGNTNLTDHQVDGMSGATLTAKGVNKMLAEYLGCYSAYLSKIKSENRLAVND